jgi:hypothetical protein
MRVAIVLVLQGIAASGADAQLVSPQAGATATVYGPRVFLDCQGPMPCDRTHFRTEIRFVNWAQDRADSDVHVIATSEQVGGGGRRFTLDFIGRGEMAHISDRLTYTSSGSDVFAETVNGLTQVLRIGLMRYAVESGLGRDFDLRFTGDLGDIQVFDAQDGSGPMAGPVRDPWNYWTFRVGVSGNANLRETSTNVRFSPNISADRVTEDWKLGFSGNLRYQRNSRELSDGRVIRDDRDEWETEGLVVRSISGHISAGMSFEGGNSVVDNRDARVAIAPALEYNYFPYLEANRRQLTMQYAAGVEHSDYREETIFNLTAETRPVHRLRLRYNAREQWGNASIGLNYSQYLHDSGLYRAGLNGGLNYRILRGLDLNVNGNASWVHDEIHIPLSTISDEDILLGRQNLPSSYQYNSSIGLSYRWGSSFTNIVNTRFSGGAGI